ncbi:MAG TPA: sugar ABC transporter ATP-binding protein [Candidatus Dormibacteraeota bacterium]|nr:sugar ABC transporter ATP-binding protein [Candidatus Dormibacteraeota bacterium]
MTAAPLLEMRGISKRFPGVVAIDSVSFQIGRGEVVAICGENGAGKSTLMKILGGVHQPDGGEILLDGRPVKIRGVNDAMRFGIAFIHQELNVLENLDVAANVFLGREPKNAFGLIDRKKIHADTGPFLKRLGLHIVTRTRLDKLSIAHQQMVEIAKALSLNARLIIMDEPTSSLTLSETKRLLELVCELSGQGVSIIYISHRLGEIGECADRIVVLRDGKNAGELSEGEATHDKLVNMMIGREIKSFYVKSETQKTPGFFKARNVRSPLYPKKTVSFDATRGEILGFAGLVGAGRSEMAKTIVGLDFAPEKEIVLDGKTISVNTPRDAIECGIYLIPENRRTEGLVVEMSVRENVSLPSLKSFSRLGLIRRGRERIVAGQQVASLKIKTPTVETRVLDLSGGTQQKVVLGKWLAMSPRVMIFDEPTRGIDVGAKAEIYRIMRALAGQGTVILMISSDMEEILNVSDRIAVMHEGEITGVLDREDCNEQNVMQLAVGKKNSAAKAAFAN